MSDKPTIPQEVKDKINLIADDYVRRQGVHDRPDITRHDFEQGVQACYSLAQQEVAEAKKGMNEFAKEIVSLKAEKWYLESEIARLKEELDNIKHPF